MTIFEDIRTADQLREFVEELNNLPQQKRYLLFNYVFERKIHDLRPKDFPITRESHFQQWWFAVGDSVVFATVKINKKNPTENPDLKTGFYENIYFHLNPDDTSGISHNQQ